MQVVKTPQTRCRAAIAGADITPPIGIYHRMWGAATHERASGVHQPLMATLLWLDPESADASQAMVIVTLDHCILDQPDITLLERAVAQAGALKPEQVLVTLSHTHAAGLMSRTRSQLPGGELIGPYLDQLADTVASLSTKARASRKRATIVYGQGRCSLAANRDYFDDERKQFVCGLNPDGPADDALLVAKIVADDDSTTMAIIVNYACHPTTLAWQNTLISPDYVGSLRNTIEHETGTSCLFLQGASGDLGPREGFVGDLAAAERNGRQLAFAALAAIEALPRPRTQFAYAGPVVSGAVIGTWEYQPADEAASGQHSAWQTIRWTEALNYRADLPSLAATQAELNQWQEREAAALASGQTHLARDYHARVEQATRQLWRLQALPLTAFPLCIRLARLGDAIWVFIPGEHYQTLQTTIRARFPDLLILVITLTGGWQPGYIPPAETYSRGIYQEQIAVVAAGSAEQIVEAVSERIRELVVSQPVALTK